MSVPLLFDPSLLDPPELSASRKEWSAYAQELLNTANLVSEKSVRLRTVYFELESIMYLGRNGHAAASDAISAKARERGSELEGKGKDFCNAFETIRQHCSMYSLERQADVDDSVKVDRIQCSEQTSCSSRNGCPTVHDCVWALALLAKKKKNIPIEETFLAAALPRVSANAISVKYKVKFHRGGQPSDSRVSGDIRLASSVREALATMEPDTIWRNAQSMEDRKFAVNLAASLYKWSSSSTTRRGSPVLSWSFGRDLFSSAEASGATGVDSLAREALKSMAATLRSDHSQGERHELREDQKPSEQRSCFSGGERFLGWRRRCGGELWLMWWQSPTAVVFGLVSPSHDDMNLRQL